MAEVEQPVTVAVLQQQQQPDVEMEAAQGEASTSKAAAATEDGAEAVGAATTTGEEAATDKKEQSQPPQQPPSGSSAVETLYLNNLNEKISTKVLKETLRNLFRTYGTVLDVVAHRNVRMRGQAFVSMANRDAAARAVKEVKGFPLYGKPINVQFARTPSDAVVKRKTPDLLEVHVEERKVRKKISRNRNPLRKKAGAKRYAAKMAALGATAPPAAGDGPAKRAAAVFIDEFLPPNKILFIQNLPDTTTKDDLEVLFKVHPNLHDIRTIPGRKGIAFVEYMDERSAITAKEALHNYKLEEDREMKVTYAKQ